MCKRVSAKESEKAIQTLYEDLFKKDDIINSYAILDESVAEEINQDMNILAKVELESVFINEEKN